MNTYRFATKTDGWTDRRTDRQMSFDHCCSFSHMHYVLFIVTKHVILVHAVMYGGKFYLDDENVVETSMYRILTNAISSLHPPWPSCNECTCEISLITLTTSLTLYVATYRHRNTHVLTWLLSMQYICMLHPLSDQQVYTSNRRHTYLV